MRKDKTSPDVLALLKRVQQENPQNYIPPEKLKLVAQELGLSLSQIYGVASFYSLLNLEPRAKHIIRVCEGGACHLLGSATIFEVLKKELGMKSGKVSPDGMFAVEKVSCLGRCEYGPVMMIDQQVFGDLTPDKIRMILQQYRQGKKRKRETLGLRILKKRNLRDKILPILENCGQIDPGDIKQYLARQGYQAVQKALKMGPGQIIEEIKASGLQGRGGAAFPTGLKWEFTHRERLSPKYVICNADEGEPGTFKDRVILDYDPHGLLEGIIIAGYAVGAKSAYAYIRGEYSSCIHSVQKAIHQAKSHGFLGKDILRSGFDFEIELREGAGSYVCGEETALIESLEGKRGNPRLRPPFPPNIGVWQKPTLVNNVETLANVRHIILNGPEWFKSLGTPKSPGTKLFCLSGDVNNPGLLEAPLGITLREIIEDWGGGVKGGNFKMAQLGGTVGPILGEEMLDFSLDYNSLRKRDLTLGSGAVLVMNDHRCIVDMLRCFLKFFQDECCGKCIPGRVGTRKLVELINSIYRGEARPSDVDLLLSTARLMAQTSLCALGQSPILPISTSLKCFRQEIMEHLHGKCPAGVCHSRYYMRRH
jgi:NADH:ubiquinone oxidoreductase subunit F (NADH-binding)/NADH:ubiquinone oxidoreductase subunit E